VQEHVELVGLSILSGARMGPTRKTIEALRAAGATDARVVVGGTVPHTDVPKLLEMGASAVLPTGTTIESLVEDVRFIASADED